MMQRAQETTPPESPQPEEGPRRIEILDDDPSSRTPDEVETLRQQVDATRQQLEALKRKRSQ